MMLCCLLGQLYKSALGNCFEIQDWGPIEFSIMTKHFERQGKPPFAYHSVSSMRVFCNFCMLMECVIGKYKEDESITHLGSDYWLTGKTKPYGEVAGCMTN
ncbi:hypothetical protein IFM89_014970 [Coptis chinensis]|uniref:Uncharacterized protein n=1 Tax=Coptis chinensis TaxID=261450 RepID=A0A835LN01_9MAGN|nr:hypothetical protein IFM89_014970 [Coptis chinensis]